MMDGVDTDDDPWILAPGDHALVMSKRGRTRLGFAILLAFFRDRGRFPRHESEVDPQGIATLSQQLKVRAPVDGEAFLVGRTAERMRSEIRVGFGFKEATVADAATLSEWLRDHAAAGAGGEIEAMVERLEARRRELAIEPPTVERVERIARSWRHLSSMLTLLGWVSMLLLGGSCATLSGGNYRSEPEQVSLEHRRFFYTLFVPAESDLMKVRAALSPPETFPPHSRASPAIVNR